MSLAPGARLGAYEILGRLAAGGMGEVYRARDTRLNRLVAVKVLHPEHTALGPEATERFAREARAIAALSHPNIVAIYDFESQGEVSYAVTELLEGRTLRTCLQQGPLPPHKSLDYARQIVRALAAAHGKRIVHRDLKPENVFVTREDWIKLLDFGLVRHVPLEDLDSACLPTLVRPTDPGKVMGTVGYMSPEQARGVAADPRSDIFSFGAVVYEMLLGERAFRRSTPAETLTAILKEEPPRLAEIARLSPALERLLRHCLEKNPAHRFQNAQDLAFALQDAGFESAPFSQDRSSGTPASIAVLPFRNLGPDRENEYLSDGITEEILNALAHIESLGVAARTSSFAFKGKDEDVRRIGQQLNVTTVLEGSVRMVGDRLRVTAQLINVADGYHLWSERFDRRMDDVFAVQDEIANAIAETLKVRLLQTVGEPLVRAATQDLEAYDSYLKGLFFFHQRLLAPAIEQFRKAVARDPNLIAAHTGLAYSLCLAGYYGGASTLDLYAASREAADRAQAIEPDSAAVHFVLGLVEQVYGWNIERGEQELRRAIALRPSYADAYAILGQLLAFSGRIEEGIEVSLQALELDPYSPIVCTSHSHCLFWARRYDEAIRLCEDLLRSRPDALPPLLLCVTDACILSGRYEKAIATAERVVAVTQRVNSHTVARLGEAYAWAGRTEEARRVVAELQERSKREYVPPRCFAHIAVALGELDIAFPLFERAIEERNAFLWAIELSPELDALRPDPRFPGLLAKVRAMAARPD